MPSSNTGDAMTDGVSIVSGRDGLTRTPDGDLEIAGRVELQLEPDAPDQRIELHLDGTFITSAVLVLQGSEGRWRVSIEPTEVDLRVGELRHRASHDPLTGLANRDAFMSALEASVERAASTARGPALFLVDLDDFKSVNDGFGHDVGDELLVEVARRLRTTSRPMDTVARLGGDEFVVLCDGVGERGVARRIAGRIVAALGGVVDVAGLRLTTAVSVGVAICEPGVDAEELLRRADVAMFHAKDESVAVAAYEGDPEIDAPGATGRRMRATLEEGAFELRYAAIRWVGGNSLSGVRPMLVHRTDDGTMVALAPTLDRIGDPTLKAEAGRRLIEGAIAEIADADIPGVRLHLPLRASEVLDLGVVGVITGALGRSGLDPESVVLEVAGDLLGRRATDLILPGLQEAGVRLAVVGFAAGRSGLALLEANSAELLLLDPTSMAGVTTEGPRRRTLEALIDLAHANDMMALASGVIATEELAVLEMLGCDLAEGSVFGPSRPLPDTA